MIDRQHESHRTAKKLSLACLAILLCVAALWLGMRPAEQEARSTALLGNTAEEVNPAAQRDALPVPGNASEPKRVPNSQALQESAAAVLDGSDESATPLPMQGPTRPIVKIRGRVVDEQGLPITTFRLTSTDPDRRSGPHREEPDFGNSFELKTRREGEWSLFVMAEGYLTSRPEIHVPLDKELVVVLKLAGSLTVRVVDSLLEPVANAEVRTQFAANSVPNDWHRSQTDAGGEVRWTDLSLGRLYVIADHDGRGFAVSDAIELTPGQLEQEVLLTLSPGGEIFGMARGHGGALEWGLELKLKRRSASWDDPLWLFRRSLRTDAEGAFSFAGVPPGDYTITSGAAADPTRSMPLCSVEATVTEGERVAVELVLEDAMQVEVSGVVVRDGYPLAGAKVKTRASTQPTGSLSRETITDQAGRFTATLSQGGSIAFSVADYGGTEGCYTSVTQTERVPASGDHELRMEYRTGSIRGRVVDAHGVKLAGASVWASAHAPAVSGRLSRSFANAHTDEDGAFVLSPLAVGTYSVSAGGGRTQNRLLGKAKIEGVEVQRSARTDGVVLTLGATLDMSTIRGHVTDPGGVPSHAARIEIFSQKPIPSEPPRLRVLTDAEGAYRVEGLVGPIYRMRAVRESQTSDWFLVETRQGEEVSRDFVLEPGAYLPVRFTGAGQGQDIYVSISDEEGRPVGSRFLEEPFARLGPLVPGSYTVTARVFMRGMLPNAETPRGTAEVVFELGQSQERLIELR